MNRSSFKKYFLRVIINFLLVICLLLYNTPIAEAQLETVYQNENSVERSLESLRDLDYQTWQVVAYQKDDTDPLTVLRIIGYPGSMRLDHPANLIVTSGIKEWKLKDITLENYDLSKDRREAAAEFDLTPLLSSISQNRPLRLFLRGAFTELPIPPYLVKEWRSLLPDDLNHVASGTKS